jgi:hypothetical protein
MSDKQVCKVTNKQQVTVVIDDVIDTKEQKLELGRYCFETNQFAAKTGIDRTIN